VLVITSVGTADEDDDGDDGRMDLIKPAEKIMKSSVSSSSHGGNVNIL